VCLFAVSFQALTKLDFKTLLTFSVVAYKALYNLKNFANPQFSAEYVAYLQI
jgi:hypothetical protein